MCGVESTPPGMASGGGRGRRRHFGDAPVSSHPLLNTDSNPASAPRASSLLNTKSNLASVPRASSLLKYSTEGTRRPFEAPSPVRGLLGAHPLLNFSTEGTRRPFDQAQRLTRRPHPSFGRRRRGLDRAPQGARAAPGMGSGGEAAAGPSGAQVAHAAHGKGGGGAAATGPSGTQVARAAPGRGGGGAAATGPNCEL